MNEKELTSKASLTEQAVKIPEDLLDQLTVRVNHDHQPDDNGMWIASVSVFKVLRILLEQSADLEQQLADQMAANERMAAEKDQLSVELATLKAAGNALLDRMETCHMCGALLEFERGGAHCEDCSSGCEGHDAPDCEHMSVPASKLKALCGGTK
jgi:predicted Zn-ribbon and HTH transcriptional regulator